MEETEFKRVLEDLDKIKELIEMDLSSPVRKKNFLRKIFSIIIPFPIIKVLKEISRKLLREEEVRLSKLFSIDFVEYVLEKKPKFNFDYFDKEDQELIHEFIDNKIYSAFLSKTQKNNLFKEQEKVPRGYKIMKSKIKRISKEGYKLEFRRKSFLLPKNNFDYSVFYYNYGLKEIPKNILHNLKNKEIIDCGAFIGDSVVMFDKIIAPKKIHAFEPESRNYKYLLKTISLNKLQNVLPIKAGVGHKKAILRINPALSSSFLTEHGEEEVKIIKIDDYSKNKNVGLIKMDIEGNEFNAILGAIKTIRRCKPILLISVYHTGRDFFEIPPFLKKINPKYKFRFLDLDLTDPLSEKILLAYEEIGR